jgi:hypothetical protein
LESGRILSRNFRLICHSTIEIFRLVTADQKMASLGSLEVDRN